MEILMSGLKNVLVTVSALCALTSCSGSPDVVSDGYEVSKSEVVDENLIGYRGAIIPHHLFVEYFMDGFYEEIANKEVERVILISPNHYGYGYSYIQSIDKKTDENSPELDLDFVYALKDSSPLQIVSNDFDKEHGIYTHFDFINESFPNAKIVPITLKSTTPKKYLDDLILAIENQDLSKTFVIGSIDFTHNEVEEIALQNDQMITDWLEKWENNEVLLTFQAVSKISESLGGENYDSVAMDSKETFYLLLNLMEHLNAEDQNLWKRTSSAQFTGSNNPAENTSHLFVSFE